MHFYLIQLSDGYPAAETYSQIQDLLSKLNPNESTSKERANLMQLLKDAINDKIMNEYYRGSTPYTAMLALHPVHSKLDWLADWVKEDIWLKIALDFEELLDLEEDLMKDSASQEDAIGSTDMEDSDAEDVCIIEVGTISESDKRKNAARTVLSKMKTKFLEGKYREKYGTFRDLWLNLQQKASKQLTLL